MNLPLSWPVMSRSRVNTRRICLLASVLMLFGIVFGSVTGRGSAAQSSDWREEYAYTLGLQAYIYAYPVTYLSELRYDWVTNPKANFYAALNHFHNKHEMANAKNYNSGGSPNNDTLYSWGWMDVSKEPVFCFAVNLD